MFIIPMLISNTFGNDLNTNINICKAGIATVMSQSPKIIKFSNKVNDALYLFYTRPSDKQKFIYKCKIQGNNIIWGTYKGRWRTSVYDSKLSFKIQKNIITVKDKYDDGSETVKTFNLKQLK